MSQPPGNPPGTPPPPPGPAPEPMPEATPGQPPANPYGGPAGPSAPYAVPYGTPGGPPAGRGSKAMAIWAFVLAILGCLPIAAVVAVGLAVAVLVRAPGARARGEDIGRGLAVAALVIGMLWLALLAGLVATGTVERASENLLESALEGPDAERDDEGAVVERTEVNVLQLKHGDCFEDQALAGTEDGGQTESFTVTVMPCSEAHQFEVYHVFDLPGSDYPGNKAVLAAADAGCWGAFGEFVGVAPRRSGLAIYYYYPQERSWRLVDDRTVQCIITDPAGAVTGSLEDAAR